jgi:small subunit ribosomal protein S6
VTVRDYEVVYIFDSNLERPAVEEKLDRLHTLITANGKGEIQAVEHWGKRPLAYPVRKQTNGYYVVVQFRAEPSNLDEFERVAKLDEGILRHLVVLSEGPLPLPREKAAAPTGRARDDDEDDDREGEEDE